MFEMLGILKKIIFVIIMQLCCIFPTSSFAVSFQTSAIVEIEEALSSPLSGFLSASKSTLTNAQERIKKNAFQGFGKHIHFVKTSTSIKAVFE